MRKRWMNWWIQAVDSSTLREKWYVGADSRTWYVLHSVKRCFIVSWQKNSVKSIYDKGKCCKLFKVVLLSANKQVVSGPFFLVRETNFLLCQHFLLWWIYCCLTNGNKLHGAGVWMAGSWGVSNPVLKDDEARASGFCGRLRPDWSQHKVLVEEKEKRRTGFRQAAVKLGELTMAALFVAGDMGRGRWGDWSDSPETVRSAFLKWLHTEYLTSSQDLTWLCVELRKKQTDYFL